MVQMIRKQIYIQKRQQAVLNRLARTLGISEAEVVRRAIDQQGNGAPPPCEDRGLPQQSAHSDPSAWAEAYTFMVGLHAQGPLPGPRRSWKREDLYEEHPSPPCRRS